MIKTKSQAILSLGSLIGQCASGNYVMGGKSIVMFKSDQLVEILMQVSEFIDDNITETKNEEASESEKTSAKTPYVSFYVILQR